MFYQFCLLCEENKIPFSITSNGRDIKIVKMLSNFNYLMNLRISIYDIKTWQKWNKIQFDKLRFYNMTGRPIKGIKDGYISGQYGIEHTRAIKNFNKSTFCRTPFNFITINTDGTVVPCYSYHHIGDINDSFLKLWNGKEIRDYRKQAVNGRNIILADCNNCECSPNKL